MAKGVMVGDVADSGVVEERASVRAHAGVRQRRARASAMAVVCAAVRVRCLCIGLVCLRRLLPLANIVTYGRVWPVFGVAD